MIDRQVQEDKKQAEEDLEARLNFLQAKNFAEGSSGS